MNKKSSLSERTVDSREEKAIAGNVVAFSPNECYSHFRDSMALIKNQFEIADKLSSDGDVNGCKNIWRSQIVFLDGILDFYISELSKFGTKCMYFQRWHKTEKYKHMLIQMSIVEEGINAKADSCEWLLKHTAEKFGRDTYMSYDSLKDQLNYLGISLDDILNENFCSTCEYTGRVKKDGLTKGKKWIRALFDRRNKIAHQMDRSINDSSEDDITKEYVEDFIQKVDLLVKKIHEKACSLSVGSN